MANAELIKALRNCACIKSDASCANCEYARSTECKWRMIEDAADALEADDEKIADCVAAIDALDDSNDAYIKENERLKKRIAELEVQIPKEGVWISDYDGFEYDVRCSVCGEEALIKEGGSHDHAYSHYCPNCGARMQTVTNCHTLEEGEQCQTGLKEH